MAAILLPNPTVSDSRDTEQHAYPFASQAAHASHHGDSDNAQKPKTRARHKQVLRKLMLEPMKARGPMKRHQHQKPIKISGERKLFSGSGRVSFKEPLASELKQSVKHGEGYWVSKNPTWDTLHPFGTKRLAEQSQKQKLDQNQFMLSAEDPYGQNLTEQGTAQRIKALGGITQPTAQQYRDYQNNGRAPGPLSRGRANPSGMGRRPKRGKGGAVGPMGQAAEPGKTWVFKNRGSPSGRWVQVPIQ